MTQFFPVQVSARACNFSHTPHPPPHPLHRPPINCQGAHSSKFPPPHYLSSGAAAEASLAYSARIMARITKGVYQQFLPTESEFKKAGRDNIKGTTLISGEHVKPCNETYWKCLITAREMKLQDDSLIKQ